MQRNWLIVLSVLVGLMSNLGCRKAMTFEAVDDVAGVDLLGEKLRVGGDDRARELLASSKAALS